MQGKDAFMYWTVRLQRSLCAMTAIFLAGLVCVGIGLRTAPAASAEAESTEGIALPIVMYHGLLKEEKRQGQYVISPDLFESDLQYLTKHGYTTVVVQDLIDYVTNGVPLPEKPIMLTFDDGYYNNYLYAYPLLQKYQCKMVLSPIGRYADEYSREETLHANYSHATWNQLKEMIESGLVEVQNHSYNMHGDGKKTKRKGSKKVNGESVEQYAEALREDVQKMQDAMAKNTGFTPTAFVYPFGAVSRESLPVLKQMGFQATLICESRINTITRNPSCLYGLGRHLRPPKTDSAAFFTKTMKLAE